MTSNSFAKNSDGGRLTFLSADEKFIQEYLRGELCDLIDLAKEISNCTIGFTAYKCNHSFFLDCDPDFNKELFWDSSPLIDNLFGTDSILEINNIKRDERFSEDAIFSKVKDINYFTGIPVPSGGDAPSAVICLLGKKAQTSTDRQKKMLQILAKEASSKISQQWNQARLKDNLHQKNIFLQNSTMMQGIIDAESLEIIDINPEAVAKLGGQRSDYIGRIFGKNVISEDELSKIHKFLKRDDSSQRNFETWISTSTDEKRYHELTFSRHGKYWFLTSRDRTEKQLLEKERERQYKAMEASTDGIAITDEEGVIIYVNDSYIKKFGFSNKSELVGQSWDINYKPDIANDLQEAIQPVLEKQGRYRGETKGLRKDGTEFDLEMTVSEIGDGDYIAIVRDITERKASDNRLQETIQMLEFAQRMAKLGTWKWEVGADKVERSDEFYNILGYAPDENDDTLEFFFEVVHPEDVDKVRHAVNNILSGEKIEQLRHRVITPEGETKHIQLRAISYESHNGGDTTILGITQDITDQIRNTQRLKASLEEKEILLSEVHHRVKNNLAVISGLLQLEAFETENSEVEEVLRENQMRIHSMAAIHELLYRDSDFSRVPFHTYLEDIIEKIQDGYEEISQRVTLSTDFNNVELNVNQAVPCGLMINEIVVNAYRHAFRNRKEGKISINLKERDNRIILRIKDNGIGFTKTFDPESKESLGTTLIKILARQLDADLKLSANGGTLYRISFDRTAKRGSSSAFLN